MAILIDYSPVVISNCTVNLGFNKNQLSDPDLVRHMILNSLRAYRASHFNNYGELIICLDSKNYWRRSVFPYYKARRSSSREKSPIDWRTIFEAMASIKEDLKEYFPYKTIEVDGAEADDVIGVLAQRDLDGKPNLIVSSDHDFQQLAMYANITQIAPVGKHKIVTEDPKTFLLEHIIKGDPGDGIPNILSSDDCIALGKRQIPMTAKKLAYYLRPFAYADASSEIRRNMDRNEQLISLAQIPSYITDKINDAFEVSPKGTRRNLLNYFISKKLKVLTASITDF